jgi:hypothetical protein
MGHSTNRGRLYGSRVIAQANTGTNPPAGGAAPPPSNRPPVVLVARVTIYDPTGAHRTGLGKTVAARLENELNALHLSRQPDGDLVNQTNVRFEVRYLARMTTRNERFGTGRLDFPIYLLNAHSGATTKADDIRELMLDHGIKDAGLAAGQFKDADKGWRDEGVEGLGIQPLDGFKKVGFIKLDNVTRNSKDFESTFVNVIKHELGHMLNIKTHADYGVMRGNIMLQGGSLDFTDANIGMITQTLIRLSTVSEAELSRRYERQNP